MAIKHVAFAVLLGLFALSGCSTSVSVPGVTITAALASY